MGGTLLWSAPSRAGGVPLEDEPEAEWAARVRERVEYLRQEARLELARDRSRGVGRAHPEEVLQAWQACLEADPTDEEAASALMRLYAAQGRRPLAVAVYERCAAALADLGLRTSPALEEVRASAERRRAPARAAPRRSAQVSAPCAGGEERRLVSAVFVELSPVGLGAQADPEDLRELIGAGLAEAISEAEAFGGTVVSVSGFGMSVLFGAPQSHEDDPERALRSALRIVGCGRPRVRRRAMLLSAPPAASTALRVALSARIGVETGAAVVGPVGSGERWATARWARSSGAAAALQSVARPGSVLVGPATRAATEGIFEWGPSAGRGPHPGRPAAVGDLPRSAAGALGRRGRAAAPGRQGPPRRPGGRAGAAQPRPCGRRSRATAGPSSSSVSRGSARRASSASAASTSWAGSGRRRGGCRCGWRAAAPLTPPPPPTAPTSSSSRRFIGAPLESGEAVLRPALEAAMRAVLGKDRELVPVLARMMGLPAGPGGAHVGRMGPAELQHAMFSAVRSVLARLVERGPTVLALEDLHWSDPTSLRLTGELATPRRHRPAPGAGDAPARAGPGRGRAGGRARRRPRPRFPGPAAGAIPKPAERALARSLLGGEVGDEVLERVCEGVDGNPLFLEERLASLLDTGALQRDGAGWRLGAGDASRGPRGARAAGPLPGRPAEPGRPGGDGGRLGARRGRSSAQPSAAVSELGAELDDALAELVSAGLLTEARSQPEPLYRFRHAIIREATYNGLLRSQRRQLHARAAWDLEASATDRLEEVAAVLGRHFAAAGEDDRAVHYLEMAGDHAARVFANEEAIASYRQALAVMDETPGFRAVPVSRPSQPAGRPRRWTCARSSPDCCMLVDRFGEARTAALAGLARVRPEDVLQAARLQYRWATSSSRTTTSTPHWPPAPPSTS